MTDLLWAHSARVLVRVEGRFGLLVRYTVFRDTKPSQIGVDEGAVSTALSRLTGRDLVEHRATYWAITDDTERLNGYSG